MSNGPIDPTVFAELAEATGSEFAQELLGTFFEEAQTLIGELKNATSATDNDRFRRAAHSLKSNAQTFGAQKLSDLARDLELNGLSAYQEANREKQAALASEFDRAASALRDVSNG